METVGFVLAHVDDTFASLLTGLALGVLLTPKLVSWIAYRERRDASRPESED